MARSHRLSDSVNPMAKWTKCRMPVGTPYLATTYLLYQPDGVWWRHDD